MTKYNYMQPSVPDDQPAYVVRTDLSGGINTRQYASEIGENQCVALTNADLGIPGETSKRPGSVFIGSDVGAASPVTLHNYEINGATDQLLMYEDTHLHKWEGTGNWSALKSDFTTSTECAIISAKMSGISPDDICIIQNGQDNAFSLQSDGTMADLGSTAGTGSDSPPSSQVMAWYGNRIWVLSNTNLYFSAAYSADYSSAFDTVSDVFRIPVGVERGLAVTRDLGLVCIGDEAIWSIFPSATPAATDRPEPLVPNMGCVGNNAWCFAGDDIYFFAPDGLRELRRTVQDKLQVGVTYPISYALKDNFESIAWTYKDRISMSYFDNKIFITVPTSVSTFETWIYYPATNAFSVMSGISPRCYAKYSVSGEEQLFYGKHGDGDVYRGWYGYTDEGTTTTNGTAISMTIDTRMENLGQVLQRKVGAEIEVRGKATGNYDVNVYAQFDAAGWNSVGTLNLTGNLVTFPTTFPVSFTDIAIAREKFHIDSYGEWRNAQVRLTQTTKNDDKQISIIEHSIVATPIEYQSE